MTEIKWQSKFTALEKDVNEGLTRMLLKGVLVDTSENKNFWRVEQEDFLLLAKDFIGKQLRVDHGEHVNNVLGRVVETEVDTPHTEAKNEWDPINPNPHIHFIAEIATKDNDLIVPIKMGFVDFVSPAVDSRLLLCSNCRTPMKDKNTKNCDCSEGSLLLKELSARELSLVASPAYEKTVAKVYSFAAAVDKELKGDTKMVDDKRLERLEASVAALIGAFKAAEEEAEKEKEEELKAEEEVKLQAEEEAKMIPVSKVAEEEEAKPEEEKEEDKEEKVEKLEAMVKQLASLMKASKITPETPEDEPANTVHKIPKVSNEPVKSEKLKDGFKFPLITGGMKPGKLKATANKKEGSSAFTGARVPVQQDAEQTAVDEIFGFAASRGTLPMNTDARIKVIRYK